MELRPYQQKCIDDCVSWIKQSTEPAVVDATVSFGKSLVIGELAQRIVTMSGKKVLILCPDGNLAAQNSEELTVPHSLFSASLGKKSVRHDIIIGTPLSIKNALYRFKDQFAAILIDEGDGITASITKIVTKIRDINKLVRVIGFTGTPYRLGTGYIFALDLYGNPVPDHKSKDPFYTKLIHQTSTRHLMDEGYLTPLRIGTPGASGYDTSALQPNPSGKFSAKKVEQAYHGWGRKTAAIVQDIVAQSEGHEGVMIFGATIQHCHEIMASLPPDSARMVFSGSGDNKKDIRDFRNKKYKYIVNKDILTVGTNFPHVSVIAVLRKTESARLLTQIIGRGLRLHRDNPAPYDDTPEGRKDAIARGPKPFCLYLDYTTDNMDTHFPDGDVFAPDIRASVASKESMDIECKCPECETKQIFKARNNPDQYNIDEYGYFVDLAGNHIQSEYGPIPGHSGRRCKALHKDGAVFNQCSYRWTSKECPHCDEPNDIAAKYCCACKGEIVDPGKVLAMEFKQLKRDPTNRQTDEVIDWNVMHTVARSGKEQIKIDWTTPYRKFSTWTSKEPINDYQWREYKKLMDATQNMTRKPDSVTYAKNADTGFYKVYAFDRDVDVDPAEGMVLV